MKFIINLGILILVGLSAFGIFKHFNPTIIEVEIEKIVEVEKLVIDKDIFYEGFLNGCVTGYFFMDLKLSSELTTEEQVFFGNECLLLLENAIKENLFDKVILEKEYVNG